MKAMTLRQPWAHAIAHLGKDVENRTQGFTAKHRGELAIHAGFGWSDLGAERTGLTPANGLARGAIVAVADVVDIHDATTRDGAGCHPPAMCSPWAIERDVNGGHAGTRSSASCARTASSTVPARGLLGLWNLPDDVTAQAEQPDLFETLAAVASDWRPTRVEARREIRKAIAACASRHGGKVHISWFRKDLPEWIDPHQIGATVSALHQTGHLASAGEYLPNGGPSGNAHKPALVRLLTKPIRDEDFED